MGRTENQDAVPMTLGQEFSAYAVMIGDGIRHWIVPATSCSKRTWVQPPSHGTEQPRGLRALCTKRLAEVSGAPVRLAENSSRPRRTQAILAHERRDEDCAVQLSNDLQ